MAEKTILDRSLDVELLAVDMLQLNKIWLGASNDQPVPAEDAAFSVQLLSYVAANGITNVKSKGAVGDGVTSDPKREIIVECKNDSDATITAGVYLDGYLVRPI